MAEFLPFRQLSQKKQINNLRTHCHLAEEKKNALVVFFFFSVQTVLNCSCKSRLFIDNKSACFRQAPLGHSQFLMVVCADISTYYSPAWMFIPQLTNPSNFQLYQLAFPLSIRQGCFYFIKSGIF